MNKIYFYQKNSGMGIMWIFCLTIVFSMLISCRPEPAPRHIALFFESDQSPTNRKHQKISYLDDFMMLHEEIVQPGKTFRLTNTSRDLVDVHFLEEDIIYRNYVFRAGDSALFSIEKKWPQVKIISEDTKEQVHNFENEMYAHFYGGKHSPVEDFYYYWKMMNLRQVKMLDMDMSVEMGALKQRAIAGLERERSYIDSIRSTGIVDDETASYYLIKNEFDHDYLALSSSDSLQFADHELLANLFEIESERDSTLNPLYFTFYDEFLTQYYDKFLSLQMQEKPMDTSPIDDLKFLPQASKSILVNKHIGHQLKTLSPEDGMDLLQKLENKMAYSKEWKTYYIDKFHLDQQFDRRWRLQDSHGEYLLFDDLLKRNRGKLIYIDFWAGWCKPCIDEISNSKKLFEAYQRDVSFVYISLDNSLDIWQHASKRFMKHNPPESYFLDSLNRIKADEEFNIVSIPRYMLFNHAGELILHDAPRPGTEEIRAIFTKYLLK